MIVKSWPAARPWSTISIAMNEQRTLRSQSPDEALSLLLDAQRKKMGVRALMVTSEDGRLLARAGQAAHRGDRVATWEMALGDRRLVITSIGGKLAPDVGEGVRRILGYPSRPFQPLM